jgi:hypothetical protein
MPESRQTGKMKICSGPFLEPLLMGDYLLNH